MFTIGMVSAVVGKGPELWAQSALPHADISEWRCFLSTTGWSLREEFLNVAFQIEVLTNSDGVRQIVNVECDSTTDAASDNLHAEELGVGCWELFFVLPADFDGTEAVFKQFTRYRLTAEAVLDACVEAIRAAA